MNLIGGGCSFDDHQITLKAYHVFKSKILTKATETGFLNGRQLPLKKSWGCSLMKTAAHDVGNPQLQ